MRANTGLQSFASFSLPRTLFEVGLCPTFKRIAVDLYIDIFDFRAFQGSCCRTGLTPVVLQAFCRQAFIVNDVQLKHAEGPKELHQFRRPHKKKIWMSSKMFKRIVYHCVNLSIWIHSLAAPEVPSFAPKVPAFSWLQITALFIKS